MGKNSVSGDVKKDRLELDYKNSRKMELNLNRESSGSLD